MATLTENNQKIEESIAFMTQHLHETITIEQLAEMAGSSTSHFFALFKQKTGHSPIDFLIRLRMQNACDLLTNTDLSVKTIARKLGYKDPYHFSRQFKRLNGTSPKYFRMPKSSADNAPSNVLPLHDGKLRPASASEPRLLNVI